MYGFIQANDAVVTWMNPKTVKVACLILLAIQFKRTKLTGIDRKLNSD